MIKDPVAPTSELAIFLPSFEGGGAERVAVILANALAVRGHRVQLLVASDKGPNRAAVLAAVSVLSFNRRHVRSCVVPLARWLRSERPYVLLSMMSHANLVAIAASCLSRSPHRLVLSERTVASRSIANDRSLKGAIIAQGIRYAYGLADAVVAVSASVARDLAQTYGLDESLLRVVYNPVDIDRVRAQAAQECDAPWWSAPHVPIILSVGRLTPEKDHLTLLGAFAKVRQKVRARLVILGEGELRVALEGRCRALGLQEDVLLPGFATNPYAAMARAHCFVLSSAWDGFPNVLVEVAALGTPIVATDCPGGTREILGGVEGAELVPVGDVHAMSEAIKGALHRSRPVVALARRAEFFSVANAVAAYEDVLGVGRERG